MAPRFFAVLLLLCGYAAAQSASPAAPPTAPADDYSGTYTFLKDGEFVQMSIEDDNSVTGFISRYGDTDSDRDQFLDQFFKKGKLDGKKLTFTTNEVHGSWYEFTGTVGRGEGKNPDDEGYYLLKGKLVQFRTDAARKTSSQSSEVAFKSFPKDLDSPAPDRK